jgi:hypothetical protein
MNTRELRRMFLAIVWREGEIDPDWLERMDRLAALLPPVRLDF